MTAPAHPDDRLTVLYFGNDWSAENRTSSHHIAARFGASCRMIYVECPGLRAPVGSKRDLGRVLKKALSCLRGTRDSGLGFRVATLFQLPFHRFGAVRLFNRLLARWSLRVLMRRHGLRAPVLHMVPPHMAHLIGRLGERLVVYYCVDDYTAYPGVDPPAIRKMDEELTRRADLVFVVSETLLAAKRGLNPNTHLSPHGVDADHFASARRPGPPPSDLVGLKGPIVGYFGLIERWFDLPLLAWMAAERPNWEFVLIGRVAVPASELPQAPNIHYLGKKPYGELPAYGRQFAAAIIPSRLDHQFAQHASPLKLREYLAMGVPVVAAATPENVKFADAIALADGRDQFLSHLDRAVSEPITNANAERRMARVADQTWDARAAAVLATIRARLGALGR